MLNSKSFLTLDFGAYNLKIGEFTINEAGGLTLSQYGLRSLGQEGTQEATREPAMQKTLSELVGERSFGSRNVNVCAPGFHTFSKFVKLPPVDTSKVTQIIQYEAQQNVPFPLEEVVWDYQILGATQTGELEVLLVAIKSDIVEGLFRVAESSSLRLQLVDVSPAALCNAFRYNYADLTGCSMLLDIGAKTSNLLFFDKTGHYSRGINIGANSITQEFAKESRLSQAEAEKLKIEQGFVSLGGAYEEPENPHAAAISKIARQVMTRLHIQVNQTVQFYRSQQGGAAPDRLFLSGGGSIMPYTAQFFSEKLNLPVEYFNPFRNVQIDPGVNLEDLSKVAHSMGEVVGLGLRNLAHCPVELNLMPKSVRQRQQFHQKKPYFIAALFCLILVVFACGVFYKKAAAVKERALAGVTHRLGPLEQNEVDLKRAMNELKVVQTALDQYTGWLEDRLYWADLCTKLREVLLTVEDKKEKEFGKKTGVWIESLIPIVPQGYLSAEPPKAIVVAVDPGSGGGVVDTAAAPPPPRATRRAGAATARTGSGTNELSTLVLRCRGVSMASVAPDADARLVYAVAEELKAQTNYFEPSGTDLRGTMSLDESGLTFMFEVTVKLLRPFLF